VPDSHKTPEKDFKGVMDRLKQENTDRKNKEREDALTIRELKQKI